MPENRHGHRAAFLGDGRLLVFGGFDDANRSGDRGGRATWLFDPALGHWVRAGDLQRPMQFHGSTSHDGTAFAISGAVECFDVETLTWKLLVQSASIPRSHFAAAEMGTRIVAAGGFENAVVEIATGAIEPLPDYPGRTPKDHFSLVAVLDGVLHVVGGYGGENFETHARNWAWNGSTWSGRSPAPRPLSAKFAAWASEPETARLFVFDEAGGLRYDARGDAWSELPAPPWSGYLVMAACAVRDGFLYVLGGQTPGGRTQGVSVFDLRGGNWVTTSR